MKLFVSIVVLIAAILPIIFHNQLLRLYNVNTLFYEDRIVSNFRSMHTLAFPYRVMSPKDSPVAILDPVKDPAVFPETFQWEGKTINLQQWLDDHWTTGLVVMKRDDITKGRLLHESYHLGNNASSKCVSWSVCKSFISATFGIAVDKGFIGDITVKTVTDYVPELVGTGYEGVRLKDVLQMSSGVAFNEDYFDPLSDINIMGYTLALGWSMDSFVASLKNGYPPGTYNHYVSIDTQVLAMVIMRATNMPLYAFVEEHLWTAVGFESEATWLMDNDENQMELAIGILGVTARDYLRFGWLYLNRGKSPATGEEVVSEAWVEASLKADSPHLMPGKENKHSDYPTFGYGYQWWLGAKHDDPNAVATDFMAIGVYNQFIYVSPENDIVIAKTSAFPDYDSEQDPDSHCNYGEEQAIEAFRAIAKAFKDL